MSTLGMKLKTLLANREWSQKKLAETIIISPDAVSSWIRDINYPPIDRLKELSDIFYISIPNLIDENYEVPKYIEIDRYLPYPMCCYPETKQDSIHIVYDADLANEGKLHRFNNAGGEPCSAIYRAGKEVGWHYREHEPRMIKDWNEVHSK